MAEIFTSFADIRRAEERAEQKRRDREILEQRASEREQNRRNDEYRELKAAEDAAAQAELTRRAARTPAEIALEQALLSLATHGRRDYALAERRIAGLREKAASLIATADSAEKAAAETLRGYEARADAAREVVASEHESEEDAAAAIERAERAAEEEFSRSPAQRALIAKTAERAAAIAEYMAQRRHHG